MKANKLRKTKAAHESLAPAPAKKMKLAMVSAPPRVKAIFHQLSHVKTVNVLVADVFEDFVRIMQTVIDEFESDDIKLDGCDAACIDYEY